MSKCIIAASVHLQGDGCCFVSAGFLSGPSASTVSNYKRSHQIHTPPNLLHLHENHMHISPLLPRCPPLRVCRRQREQEERRAAQDKAKQEAAAARARAEREKEAERARLQKEKEAEARARAQQEAR